MLSPEAGTSSTRDTGTVESLAEGVGSSSRASEGGSDNKQFRLLGFGPLIPLGMFNGTQIIPPLLPFSMERCA